MIGLNGSSSRLCDGISRRTLLQAGSLGLGGSLAARHAARSRDDRSDAAKGQELHSVVHVGRPVAARNLRPQAKCAGRHSWDFSADCHEDARHPNLRAPAEIGPDDRPVCHPAIGDAHRRQPRHQRLPHADRAHPFQPRHAAPSDAERLPERLLRRRPVRPAAERHAGLRVAALRGPRRRRRRSARPRTGSPRPTFRTVHGQRRPDPARFLDRNVDAARRFERRLVFKSASSSIKPSNAAATTSAACRVCKRWATTTTAPFGSCNPPPLNKPSTCLRSRPRFANATATTTSARVACSRGGWWKPGFRW